MTARSPKCIVDTNVPVTANLARTPSSVPDDLVRCVAACVEAILRVTSMGGLVLDSGDEICGEYRKELCVKGKPGVGDAFAKWVHDTRWTLPAEDLVPITRDGASYKEFPGDTALAQFDNDDRKFVAVANAHKQKPPILQATDSKWWNWRTPLSNAGITVEFLCGAYVEAKCHAKSAKHRGTRRPLPR